MKIDNLVAGLIVLAFAAILLADAILTTVDPARCFRQMTLKA
jgi:hypothetical protein